MNYRDYQDMLRHHAKQCAELADKLSETGGDLKENDRKLLRIALMPRVEEMTDMMKSAFMFGNVGWLDTEIERLKELSNILTF